MANISLYSVAHLQVCILNDKLFGTINIDIVWKFEAMIFWYMYIIYYVYSISVKFLGGGRVMVAQKYAQDLEHLASKFTFLHTYI